MALSDREIRLGPNESVIVRTHDGRAVYVNDMVNIGLSVLVYDDPAGNPVSTTYLKDKAPRAPISAEEFFARLDKAEGGNSDGS